MHFLPNDIIGGIFEDLFCGACDKGTKDKQMKDVPKKSRAINVDRNEIFANALPLYWLANSCGEI